MPVSFRDVDDVDTLGTAAYLTIQHVARESAYLGALFVVNARGEPIEFTYNRVETPQSFLWRATDLRRRAQHKLTVSLLSACTATPLVLLCGDENIEARLFAEDIRLSIPVVGVSRTSPVSTDHRDNREDETAASPHMVWLPAAPPDGSPEKRLVQALISRGLLTEPFERATAGLTEVFASAE